MAPTMKGTGAKPIGGIPPKKTSVRQQAKGRIARPAQQSKALSKDSLDKAKNAGPIEQAEKAVADFLQKLDEFSWGFQNVILADVLKAVLMERHGVVEKLQSDLQDRNYDIESFHKLLQPPFQVSNEH